MDKRPLKAEEKSALRTLFAAVSSIIDSRVPLEKRIQTSDPNAWTNLETISQLLLGILRDVLTTIPVEQIKVFQAELQSVKISTEVRKNPEAEKLHGAIYVPLDVLGRVIDRAMSLECYCCELKGCDIAKCEIRKDIQALYPYDFPKTKGGCPLAGASFGFFGGVDK